MIGYVDTEQMYVELLNYYGRHSFRPREILEREIAERVSAGMSREEAIAALYREVFGTPKQLSGERGASLEEALESLKAAKRDYSTLVAAIWVVLAMLTAAASASGYLDYTAAALVLFSLLASAAVLRLQGRGGKWVWREVLSFEGVGEYWKDFMELIPRIYQKLSLRNVKYEIEDETLILRMSFLTTVTMLYKSGPQTLTVDLGPFTVKATFRNIGGTLYVEAVYEGRPPVAYADHAALAYERAIATFRAALEEAYELVKPRAVVVVNFAELAELLASKGLVVAAVRCPYCGGSVELPKEGDTTKCPYCGTALKAIDLYRALKEVIRGL
jgi:hypothetical protein